MMKRVIQEVMKGNRTIVSHSQNRPGKGFRTSTSEPNEKQDRAHAPASLKEIRRPNYQRLKQDKRLSFAKKDRTTKSSSAPARGNRNNRNSSQKRTNPASVLPKQFNEESISTLSSLSLAQGHVSRNQYALSRDTEKSRLLGKTKNGGYVWFYPHINQDLSSYFNRSLSEGSAGVVHMPDSFPSYLLWVNEVIRQHPEIKFHLSWDPDGEAPFTVELYDDQIDRLENIMNDLYQKLNRRSMKQFEAYTAESPSTWLSKQLHIQSSVDAIAFLEGIHYYTSIVLIDQALDRFSQDEFTYEIKHNYLLISGQSQVVSQIISELKKEVTRL